MQDIDLNKFEFLFCGSESVRINNALKQMARDRVVKRIWDHDFLLWQNDSQEIINRLGWLHSPVVMQDAVGEINLFVSQIRSEGFTRVVLLGMGGSSLAPEVFRTTFGICRDFPDLQILDSTDPRTVLSREKFARAGKTLFVVATKSGGTIETISFLKYFYRMIVARESEVNAGQYFVAITDPDSSLEEMANRLRFRKVFLNNPNIGGRFSALSYFGLVPAALIGVDISELLKRAAHAANSAQSDSDRASVMGAVIGSLAKNGRDKLTLILSPGISGLGVWIEQLVAESTGKQGQGILPVDHKELLDPDLYLDDRIFVHLYLKEDGNHDQGITRLKKAGFPVFDAGLSDKYEVAAEFFRWEIATSVAGHFLGINPYDQPDVESAKIITRKNMSEYEHTGKFPEPKDPVRMEFANVYGPVRPAPLARIMTEFLDQLPFLQKPQAYVCIQAFMHNDPLVEALLRNIQSSISRKYRVATTYGFGPRFLHSTGQLHKGDAGHGLFIQINGLPAEDARIPNAPDTDESAISFGILRQAQSLGDLQALQDAGRRVLRIDLLVNDLEGIRQIMTAVQQ